MQSVVSSTLPAPSRKRLELVGERLPGSTVMHSEGETHGIQRGQIHGLTFYHVAIVQHPWNLLLCHRHVRGTYLTVPIILVAQHPQPRETLGAVW